MDLKWNGEIGPASIIGAIGSLSVLVAIGMAWGTLSTKQDTTQATVKDLVKHSDARDTNVSTQAERLGKVETAVNFIIPTLQRIETRLIATTQPSTLSGWPPLAAQPAPALPAR